MRLAQCMFRCFTAASLAFAFGCDPGYRMKPVAWKEERSTQHWSHNFEAFSIRTRSLGRLVGEWWLRPTFEVFGNSERVILKAAYLETATGRYMGVVDPRGASAPPGGGSLSVDWDFGREHPAVNVLGTQPAIVLDLDAGSRPYTVRIDYEQTSCC